MTHKSRIAQFVLATIIAACMIDSSLAAAGIRAPAGQICPTGSYVIGFDSQANIICTEACGNGVLNPGETCDDGNIEAGDSCSPTCQEEEVVTQEVDEDIAPEVIPTAPGIFPSIPELIISRVRPAIVVFGTSELAITVSGTSFNADSVIIFTG